MEDVVQEVTKAREVLEIFQSDGYWWASQGIPLEVGYRDKRLAPVSTHIPVIIAAIEKKYPGRYRIRVSPGVTKNPFVRTHIETAIKYGMAPDYNFIQQALDHPKSEPCTLCKGEAWYNGRIGHYECSKCGAHEIGGEFIKIRRRIG